MVKSIKGKEVNMAALMLANQYSVAVGNARMNARGDLLGKNGEIVKTREQLGQEYHQTPANKAVSIPISKDVIEKVKIKTNKKPVSQE